MATPNPDSASIRRILYGFAPKKYPNSNGDEDRWIWRIPTPTLSLPTRMAANHGNLRWGGWDMLLIVMLKKYLWFPDPTIYKWGFICDYLGFLNSLNNLQQ